MSAEFKWFFEERGDGEYQPPHIGAFLQGWKQPKADLKTEIEEGSEVFIREVIQNFMDAASDPRAKRDQGVKPRLTFRFLQFDGDDAKQLWKKLDLYGIQARYQSLSKEVQPTLRLPESNVLKGQDSTLRLLVVSEEGTCGMYGPWSRSAAARDVDGSPMVHRMRDALLATVRGQFGAGLGSYGEGKKAVIGASAVRGLYAYSCFADPNLTYGATRRAMGGLYWQNYEFNDRLFSGFATVGEPKGSGERPDPLVDARADQLVSYLDIPGFGPRDAARNEFGTSYLFIAPSITPAEAQESILRNWWPAIERGMADFEVIDEKGHSLAFDYPQYLRPFVEVFNSNANQVSDWEIAEVGSTEVEVHDVRSSSYPSEKAGQLKLGVNLSPIDGWSWSNPDTNCSIVALVRDGMLISYQHFPRAGKLAAPFIRGTYAIDRESSPKSANALRFVEPPLHNKWEEHRSEYDSDHRRVAKEVHSFITEKVLMFREAQLAAAPQREVKLELFKEKFSLTGGGKVGPGPGPTPKRKSPWSMLAIEEGLLQHSATQRYAFAVRSLALSSPVNEATAAGKVSVEIGWEVLEDGRWVEANEVLWKPGFELPTGFVFVNLSRNVFTGTIPENGISVRWESLPYSENWTLRPYMKVSQSSLGTETAGEVEDNAG